MKNKEDRYIYFYKYLFFNIENEFADYEINKADLLKD